MSTASKKVLAFTLMILLLLSSSGVAFARKQGPVWQKGTVTKAAWTEGKEKYIEVDGETYNFLPDDTVKISRQYKAPNGQWYSEKLSLDKVRLGTTVLIKGEGLQIYELIVEEL